MKIEKLNNSMNIFQHTAKIVLEKLEKKSNVDALDFARKNVGKIESKHSNSLYCFKYFNPKKNKVEESSALPLQEIKDLRSQVLITLAMHFLGEENHMVYEGGYWTQYIIHRDEFNKPKS